MGFSRKFGLISLVVVALSWGIILFKGFNYGIDFAGGTLIQVKYEGKAPLKKIRAELSKYKDFKDATVTNFGSEDEIVIKTKDKQSKCC